MYGKPSLVSYVPKSPSFGVDNSADLVLTFRNVHNWRMAEIQDALQVTLEPCSLIEAFQCATVADLAAIFEMSAHASSAPTEK
ncbi:putative methyltransferase [Xanthomonas citri pv. fuscans]|nr:putative methyltransferase [Xanthomonas citri pv. fuscans]